MASSDNANAVPAYGDVKLLPVDYISPPPGERAEVNVVRFCEPHVDDVVAKPTFSGLTGRGVRVAVIDTGIDTSHPALVGRVELEASRNFSGGDSYDYQDRLGHGTHVAGIIAAQEKGAIMTGIAPAATLIAIKVFDDYGRTTTATITRAIRHAICVGAKVINLSFGGTERPGLESFSDAAADEYAAIQDALAKGVVVVAAAGNTGHVSGLNEINPPGAYGGVVTVASHDDAGVRSAFSSQGGELDFMAPGETWSTWPVGVGYQGRLGRAYEQLRGTSMACPLVAGLAALLVQAGRDHPPGSDDRGNMSPALQARLDRSDFRARNNYEVREVLRSFADRPEEHRREDGYGSLSAVYKFVKTTVEESQLSVHN